ncbi:MAG TPA: hypothetical protein DIC64_03305 [Alphaproteobacteria bacterium]|nr:hypothetical protein [Alphaproteobacteria bacterium]
MKKISRYLLAVLLLYASEAFAFVIPPCPICPSVDFVNDGVETGKAFMKKLRTIADELQRMKDETLNAIKSAGNLIGLNMQQSPLQKEEGAPVLATEKEIADAKIADVRDADSVATAYQTLFLQYPTDLFAKFPSEQREAIVNMYDNKRVEFANDNMMELSLSVRDLEQNRMPALQKEIETLSDCYVSGNEGASALCESASAADEELGNWANQYKLQGAYDNNLRFYQGLVALKAQYESGVALQKGVRPFNEDELKKSKLESKENMSYNMHYQTIMTSGFAQAVKTSLVQQDDVAARASEPAEKTQKKVTNKALALERSVEFKKHTPFEGAEEQMNALPLLDGAYEMLSEAQKMHNTKQQLPNLRKPFLEYEKMNALHDVAIEKLVESETKNKTYFTNFYDDKTANDLWFGNGCALRKTKLGKKCPTVTGCQGPKDYDDYYTYHIMCAKDIYPVTAYEKKDGLSGYVISAYKLSKADKILNDDGKVIGYVNEAGSALDLSGKKIGVFDKDAKTAKDKDGKMLGAVVSAGLTANEDEIGTAVIDLNMEPSIPDIDSEPDLTAMVGGDDLTAPSAEDQAEVTMREENLNRWQIGSEASKLVGADMQGEQSFGKPKGKYPVWADEKRFYKQYFESKFENLHLYLNSPRLQLGIFDLAKFVSDSMTVDQKSIDDFNSETDNEYKSNIDYWLNESRRAQTANQRNTARNRVNALEKERDQKKENYKKELEELLKTEQEENARHIAQSRKAWESAVNDYESSSPLLELQTAQSNEKKQMKDAFDRNIQDLEKQKAKLYAQIDEKFEILNEKKKKYNDLKSAEKDAQEGAAAEEENIKRIDERKQKDPSYVTELAGHVGMRDKAIARKTQYEQDLKKAQEDSKDALEGVDVLQDDMSRLKKQVEQIDQKIEKLKQDYIVKAVKTEYEQHEAMKKALKNRAARIPLMSPSLLLGATKTLSPIYAISTAMLEKFKENADLAVTKAHLALTQMGDKLYDADNYNAIHRIHKQMLNDMKTGEGYQLAEQVLSGLNVSNALLMGKVGSMMFSIILGSEDEYEKEDTVYMVTMDGRQRDFYAMKRISPERTAPVREVFHFDITDYDAILKTNPILKVTPLPILKKPQTTKEEFLKFGQAIPAIWRKILEPKGFEERDVDIEDIIGKSDNGSKAFLEAKGEKPVTGVGELSIFFKYDEGLTFTDAIFELAEFFDKAEKEDSKIKEEDIKENEKKMLARNQIGDYLQFMDLEQTYKTQINQLKVKVDESKRSIGGVLEKVYCPYKKKEVGYIKEADMRSKIVSTEYIADEETYQAIAKCLDEGKNMFIKEALALLAELPTNLSDYIVERKEKLDNMIKALQMDNEELVQLSDNTEANDELAQDIKSKRTDGSVVGRYDEEAQSEFEKNMDQFEEPYLAKYF